MRSLRSWRLLFILGLLVHEGDLVNLFRAHATHHDEGVNGIVLGRHSLLGWHLRIVLLRLAHIFVGRPRRSPGTGRRGDRAAGPALRDNVPCRRGRSGGAGGRGPCR